MIRSELADVPAGWVQMGSDEGQEDERPIHRVWVDAFAMAVYPVTRGEYALFLDATGHDAPREWTNPRFAAADLPVVGVSWVDAAAYCAWRSRSGAPLRLPTEAEWEHAARGGRDGERYPWGDAIPSWVPNAGRGPLQAPWAVTLGDPNRFGLYGIAANVHEWCADWHAADYYQHSPERNPTGPEAGLRRASRGGSWRHAFTISRSAARSKLDPTFRYTDYGFRVARDA
jgi:formylglycine-generating enzyme required for sulfatase activity